MKFFTLSYLLCLSSFLSASEKPNFLFILADDQSYETIHALGNDEIRTPNLDRLVEQGTSFTNAYNMGGWNGAICVASRTMLNTGKMLWRARKAETELDKAAMRDELWSQLLSKVGYETYFTGKWHIKINPNKIFDYQVHERPGMPGDSWARWMMGISKPDPEIIQTLEGYNRPVRGKIDVWSPFAQSFGGFWEGGKHWSEVLADDAIQFLETATKSAKPFFMYLAFNAPHDPRQSPKRFVDLYPLDRVQVPASYMPMYPYKDEIGCGPTLRDEALAPFPRTEFAVKTHRQEYYASISHMDEQIGRILVALANSGKGDNTYIIFTADQGLACGNHGLLGKQNMYEHSMRSPLIIVGPHVPANERREALVYLQDVMATTLDLAGLDKPAYVEFNSLMPLIRDSKAKGAYDAIYGCYLNDAQRMIRDGDMKLIVYPGSRLVRLFDLAADPQEIHDIAGDPSQWPNIRRLFGKLINLQADMEDDFNLAKDFPELLTASNARSAWEKLVLTHMPPRLAKQSPFAYTEPVPALPNVLIYGDSISIDYTPVVRSSLKGVANVYRLYCNGGDSGGFISKVKKMEADMRDPRLEDPWNFHWNVIHFNVGLHDLKYLNGNQLDTANGRQVHSLKQYQQNLREIIEFLQTTYPQARLIFATTTPVPAGAAGRVAGDATRYNTAAMEVLRDYPKIKVNDLYGLTKLHESEWHIAPNDVHYNAVGASAQGKQVASVIMDSLASGK